MKTRTFLALVAMAVVLAVVSSPAVAVTVVYEDMESYTVGSNLTGQTASNGQVWATGGWLGTQSMVIGASYGSGWSTYAGAGGPANYPADGDWFTNELPLGVQMTSGVITVEGVLWKRYDDAENVAVYQQFGLKDSVHGTNVMVGWAGFYDANNNWDMYAYVDGGGLSSQRMRIAAPDFSTYRWTHIVATIDMATLGLTVAYDDTSGHSGSFYAGTIAPLYGGVFSAPDTLQTMLYYRTSYGYSKGFDNLKVTHIPEPGSLLALGMGAMSLAGFAIRRRK